MAKANTGRVLARPRKSSMRSPSLVPCRWITMAKAPLCMSR